MCQVETLSTMRKDRQQDRQEFRAATPAAVVIDEWLTIQEVAELSGASAESIWARAKRRHEAGDPHYKRAGKAGPYLVSRDEADRWCWKKETGRYSLAGTGTGGGSAASDSDGADA